MHPCVRAYLLIFTASGPNYCGGGGGGRPRSDGEGGGCADLSGGSVLGTICDDLPELQKDAGQVRHLHAFNTAVHARQAFYGPALFYHNRESWGTISVRRIVGRAARRRLGSSRPGQLLWLGILSSIAVFLTRARPPLEGNSEAHQVCMCSLLTWFGRQKCL